MYRKYDVSPLPRRAKRQAVSFLRGDSMYASDVLLNTIRYYPGHSTIQMKMHYLRPDIEDADENVIEKVFG